LLRNDEPEPEESWGLVAGAVDKRKANSTRSEKNASGPAVDVTK